MEEHEEIHSQTRWRRVCDIMDGTAAWKAVHPEDRKVSEGIEFLNAVTFSTLRMCFMMSDSILRRRKRYSKERLMS